MSDEPNGAGAEEKQGTSSEPSPKKPAQSENKVEVILKAVGDAPIMKQKKWSVDKTKTVAWILAFLRKYLKFESADSLFIYVNQCFAPTPDHTVGCLFECFGSDGKLVLHYSKTQAWG